MKFFVLFCQTIMTLASGCLLHSSALANEEPVDGAPSLYVDDTDNTSVEAIINESNSDIDDNILSSNSSNSNDKVDSSKKKNKKKEDSDSDIPPMTITEMVEVVAKNKNTTNATDTNSDLNIEKSTTNNIEPSKAAKKKETLGENKDSQSAVDSKTNDANIDRKIDVGNATKTTNTNEVDVEGVKQEELANNQIDSNKLPQNDKSSVDESVKKSNDVVSHNNQNVENTIEDTSKNQSDVQGIQSTAQITDQSLDQNAKNVDSVDSAIVKSATPSANITEANTNKQINTNNTSSAIGANSSVSVNASDNNSEASTPASISASTDNSGAKKQNIDSVTSSVKQIPEKQGQTEVTTQNTSAESSQLPIGVTDTANQSLIAFYTRGYLQNMYLPLFYNTYELPQSLNSYVTLRNVKVAEKGTSLVYEIGVAEQYGPMDLEGTPRNNKLMKLFCKIAINDGILHRIDGIDLVFFHDEKDFFEKNLDYNECTGFDITQVDDSILEKENQRLSEEFVYAYKLEQGSRLSHDYLVNKFAPFALTLINEKFADLEQNKKMSVENDTNLVITFFIDEKDVSNIQKNEYITDRINRTCNIDSYSKWVLPRIDNLIYRYMLTNDRTEQGIRKEIIVDAKTCSFLSNKSVIN